jgi:hypothetical protein
MVVQAQNPPRPPAVNGVLAHAVSRGRRGHVMRAARSFITPSHCCSPPVCSKVETMSAEEVSADDGTGIAMEEVMKHTTSDSAWLSIHGKVRLRARDDVFDRRDGGGGAGSLQRAHAGWTFTQVYDVTKYLDDHPGGNDVLLDASGTRRRLAHTASAERRGRHRLAEVQ